MVSGTKSAVPFSCWLSAMPITRNGARGPRRSRARTRSPTACRWTRARLRSTTATRARAALLARGEPAPVRRSGSGTSAACAHAPDDGVLAREPDVGGEHRLDRGDAGRRPDQALGARVERARSPIEVASRPRRGRATTRGVVSEMAAARPRTASRLPTASATISAVARLRRLRRPTPRRPICACAAGTGRAAAAGRRASWPPTAEPVASSASRRSTRTPRRIAGSAASGGAEQADERRSTSEHRRVDAEADVDREERRAEVAHERGSRARSRARRRRRVPSAPSRSAVLT